MVYFKKCFKINSLFISYLFVFFCSLLFAKGVYGLGFKKTERSDASLLKIYPQQTVKLAGKTLKVYVARTDFEHSQGLMFVEKLPEDTGMLFIFSGEATRSFWMKNTKLNLDIGFFDAQGVLKDIQQMEAGFGKADSGLPSYASRSPAQYALELEQGWFKKNGVKLGDKLNLTDPKVQ